MKILGLFVFVAFFTMVGQLKADLLTFEFSGTFNSDTVLSNAGDAYSGSFTFDDTASVGPNNNETSINAQSGAISTNLPGTSWEMTVASTLISPFTIGANFGSLSIGNNTIFGDRYIVTLSGDGFTLPTGEVFNFFQIDLQDSNAAGADLVDNDNPFDVPSLENYSLGNSNGRFFIANPSSGCSQCFVNTSSLTPVPEPASSFAMVMLGLSAGLRRQR